MLILLSYLFEFITKIRNKLYDNNIFKSIQTNAKVISIGNLTVGGTGKTPLTILIGNFLKDQNKSFFVVGRGYGRKGNSDLLLNETISYDISKTGDEMAMIHQILNVPVVISNSKSDAAKKYDSIFNTDYILIDDGFQHRRLKRDLDIVIINQATINQKYLIPKGRLRENILSLNRANLLGFRDLSSSQISDFFISNSFLNDKKWFSFHSVFKVYKIISNELVPLLPEGYKDIKFLAFCSIANSNSFFEALEIMNINIGFKKEFQDHYLYQDSDIIELILSNKNNSDSAFICTEKDLIKLSNTMRNQLVNLYILKMEFEIDLGKEDLIQFIQSYQ